MCVRLFVSSSLKNACDHQTIRRRIFSLWFGNVPNSFTSSCDDVCWHFFVMSSYAALRTFQFLCSTRCSNGNRAALDSSSASSDIIAGPLGIAKSKEQSRRHKNRVCAGLVKQSRGEMKGTGRWEGAPEGETPGRERETRNRQTGGPRRRRRILLGN